MRRLLHEPQLAGAGDGLGAPLDLELLEDPAVVALDGVESEEEALADLLVREPCRDQLQDLTLARTQRLNQ